MRSTSSTPSRKELQLYGQEVSENNSRNSGGLAKRTAAGNERKGEVEEDDHEIEEKVVDSSKAKSKVNLL